MLRECRQQLFDVQIYAAAESAKTSVVQHYADMESTEATWVPKHNEDAAAGHPMSQAGDLDARLARQDTQRGTRIATFANPHALPIPI